MEMTHSQKPLEFPIKIQLPKVALPSRLWLLGTLICGATVLFEAFNYSTTQHALGDAFGDLGLIGIPLATILAVAFCGLDFAGIARLLSPYDRSSEGKLEGVYLLAAWLLAGSMNAVMTWWSVTESLAGRPGLGNEVFSRHDLILYVPIIMAGAVWLIRILLIGTLTMSGRSFFTGRPQALPQTPVRAPVTQPVFAATHARPFTGGRS